MLENIGIAVKIWEFYNKNKGFFNLLFLSIIILLVVFLFQQRSDLRTSERIRMKQRDTMDVYRDEYGRLHASLRIQNLKIEELNDKERAQLDSMSNLLNIKNNQIDYLITLNTETRGSFEDTLEDDNTFSTSDGFLTLKGKLNGLDSFGKFKSPLLISGDYFYRDQAKILAYRKKKKFLGITYKTEPYLDIHFQNHKTSITGLENISIGEYYKKPLFTVGLQAGYYYIPRTNRFDIGAGIGITFTPRLKRKTYKKL